MKRWVRGPCVALLLAVLVFLPFVGRRDVVTSHEARVVQVARAMAESGWPWNARRVRVPQVEKAITPDGERLVARKDGATIEVNPWLVPVINGTPRLQKPPLPYWCAAVLFRIFGESAGAARVIPALLGAWAAVLIFDLTESLMGRRAAIFASLVWVSSYFIVDEFRKAMADPYLGFFVLASVTSWVRASQQDSRGALLRSYALAALAALAKGPVMLVQIVPMLAAYHLGYRKRLPRRGRDHVMGLALFAAIALPWPIAILAMVEHALEFWRYQSVGTFADNVEKARPWWFYPPNLLLIGLPWTPIELLGIAWIIVHRNRRRLVPLVALIVILAIFSASHVKKNAYLLPMMPLMVVLAAQGLMVITIPLRQMRWPAAETRWYLLFITIGWVVAISLFLNVVLTNADNARSPRWAALTARRLQQADAGSAIWTPALAEEASVYLPLDLKPKPDCRVFYAIINVTAMPSYLTQLAEITGQKPQIDPVDSDGPRNRWQVYRLTFDRPVNVAPAAVESD